VYIKTEEKKRANPTRTGERKKKKNTRETNDPFTNIEDNELKKGEEKFIL
jgi:hypothetical protein